MNALSLAAFAGRRAARQRPTQATLITRAEWRWAIGAAFIVVALACVPYLVAVVRQDAALRFTGFLITADDGNTYLAKMAQGARGDWFYTSMYAADPGRPVFLFPFYYLLGRLTGEGWTTRVIGYHVARVVFGFGYLVAAYAWAAEFVPRVRGRRLALGLIAFGGGLGWLALGAGGGSPRLEDLPLDLYLPEAFSFLSLLTLPHIAAARFGLVLSLLCYRRGRATWAGLTLMLVAFIVPLYPVVAGLLLMLGEGVVLTQSGLNSRDVLAAAGRLAWLVIPSSPYVTYVLALARIDPALAGFMDQNVLLSPAPWHYALAYGPWLGVGWWGWRGLRRDAPRFAVWAAVWLALGVALTYIPITTQRRIIDGYWLWLAPLAARGLLIVARGSRARRWLLPVLLIVTAPGPLLAWGGALAAAIARPTAAFIPAGQVAAFEWLAAQSDGDGVALSAFQTGNWVPAYTALRAYLGHGVETPDIHGAEARVALFFGSAATIEDRQAVLHAGHIRYVLWGPEERALGAFDPGGWDSLEKVYDRNGYAVFVVRSDVAP